MSEPAREVREITSLSDWLSWRTEADALARIIAIAYELAYEPQRKLTDPPDPDVVRLIGEALQCAYEAGRDA